METRRTGRLAPSLAWILGLAGLALAAPPAAAQCSADLSCQYLACRAGATSVPVALWGTLRPVDTGPLPIQRDNTNFDPVSGRYNELEPHWMSLDIENGWIFAAINQGLQVWDARGFRARSPQRLDIVGRAQFPFASSAGLHENNPIRDVDAPPNFDGVVAVASVADMGIAVFDSSDKSNLLGRYSDKNRNAHEVYATTIGGRHYAFLATQDEGLLAYDLSSALSLGSPCVDDTPTQQSCGVYRGRLGTSNSRRWVDGVGDYLAASAGLQGRGVELWDVSNPAAPTLLFTGLPNDLVFGVALWRRGSSTYLALRHHVSGGTTRFRIYDLSCLDAGGCSGLGSPLVSWNLPGGASEYTVTHSASAGRDYLYLGAMNNCAQGPQEEWLLDVSSPSGLLDLTPPAQIVGGQLVGYWGWYYRRNPTGFNRVSPRRGKVAGDIFYRAAYSIFDLHEIDQSGIFSDGFEGGTTGAWSGTSN